MTALEKLRAYTPIDAKTNTAPATDKKTVAGALDRLRAYTPIDAGAKEVKEFDSQAMIKVSPLDTRAKQVKQLVPKQTSSSYYTPEFSKWAETERKGVADTVGALYNTPKKVADFMKTTGKKAEAQGIDKLSKVSDNAIFDGANSYESEYTKWRSTVRNEQDVEKDIKKIIEEGIKFHLCIDKIFGFEPDNEEIDQLAMYHTISFNSFSFSPGQLFYAPLKRFFDIVFSVFAPDISFSLLLRISKNFDMNFVIF